MNIKTLFNKSKIIALLWLCLAFPVLAAIEINVDVTGTNESASTLSKKVFIERVELSFPNKRPSQSVAQFSKGFYARARFKYLGNGPLTVRWMVDGRVVSQTTEILSFGKEVNIRSDKNKASLPTFTRGSHKVNIQFINSSGVIDVVTKSIKYFVSDGVAEFEEEGSLKVMFPKNRSVDAQNFYFRWQGIKRFSAYQIVVESLATKSKKSQSLIKALSKIDVYSPSDSQRLKLTKGEYRWRVKGLYKDKNVKPLWSEWASFEINSESDKGGIFIVGLNTEKVKSTNEAAFNIKNYALSLSESIIKKQNVLSKWRVSGGDEYRLGIQLQNSTSKPWQNLVIEVLGKRGVISRYPVNLPAKTNSAVSVPIKMQAVDVEQYENLTINLIDGGDAIDQAALNLTIEPKVNINGLDFIELDKPLITTNNLSFCGEEVSGQLVFSKIVSALKIASSKNGRSDYEEVSFNSLGYFSFAQGQTIQFAAFLQDKGLANWLAANCPTGFSGKENQQLVFKAYRIDESGAVNNNTIELGNVVLDDTFKVNFEGIVYGSQATIPATGQYKITLSDISTPIDLYATRKKGLPQYVYASGFKFEVVSLSSSSSLNKNQTPYQAQLSGVLKTTWKNDSNETELRFNASNLTVSMNKNPLHADLLSGQIALQQGVDLSLFGVDFRLNDLMVDENTALAQLAYRLPSEYRQSETSSKVNLSSVSKSNRLFAKNSAPVSTAFSQSKSSLALNNAPISAQNLNVDQTELIQFNDVPVFNGGEFIARHQFAYDRKDISLLGSRLALRLKNAEFIADLSDKVNVDDYAQQAEFMGVGFYGAVLRLKISEQNGLFGVSNENPYIYAKSQWLGVGRTGLFGDDIEVVNDPLITDFFGQKAASSLSLMSPFGFEMSITGGTFGLASSQVTGIDLKGTLQLPNADNSLTSTNYALSFDHLVRDADGFKARMTDENYAFDIGVFRYQPEDIVLHIKPNNVVINNATEPPSLANLNQQAILDWKNLLNFNTQAGLLLSGGQFNNGWAKLSDTRAIDLSDGKLLLTAQGVTGQWLAYQPDDTNRDHFEINQFDTSVASHWLRFDNSVLTDSIINGFIHIPYPVNTLFSFVGKMNQEAGLDIAEDGLSLVTSETNQLLGRPTIALDYWNAELSTALSSSTRDQPQHVFFDAENSRILLNDFFLRLKVDEDFGGEEFMAKGGQPAFKISTYVLPNGQLEDTNAQANLSNSTASVSSLGKSLNVSSIQSTNAQANLSNANDSIRFLGQPFSLNSLEFLPYIGNAQAPDDDADLTATPLVKIKGSVGFSIFGLQYTEINHTALGARVPVVSPEFGLSDESGDGYFGDDSGMIKVAADLKFSNTYGLESKTLKSTVELTTDATVNAPQPYKAFVGEAELVLIDAFSIKGLAEAGLHLEQDLPDANGNWKDGVNDVAYERIGLGTGVDVLKAAIAAQDGFDNAARLGAAGIAVVSGADGLEKEVIELGTEGVILAKSVAVAVTLKTPDAILNAVDSGLTATDKGIDLLQAICLKGDLNCTPEIDAMLEISSILLRGASVATSFPEIDPKRAASVVLQTIDSSIPVLKRINPDTLFNNQSGVSLMDKHQAALSLAQTQVIAARSLVDNDGKIPFSDFMRISQSFVESIEAVANISEINGLLSDSGAQPILDLSIALAKESVAMAQDIKNNPSPQKLASLAKDYVDLLCQQSDNLQPLLPVELRQSTNLLKPVMGISSLVLNQLAQTSMPANPQLALQFLRSVLQTLGSDSAGSAACGGNGLSLPPTAKAMLKIAAHSLQPLTGTLKTSEDQIVWALEGTQLSIEVMRPIAQAANLDTQAIAPIKSVLNKLIQTFRKLDDGLNSDADIANGQKVLRMAAGIPNAFNELIKSSGATQASELMDVYVVIMSELDRLLNHAKDLAKGDDSGIDLLELPIKIIEQTQSLSFVGQNEKLNLANVSALLAMSREVTSEQPKLSKVMAQMSQIHANIKVLGGPNASNPANKREVEQVMVFLQLLAGLADDQQQISKLLIDAISDLIPHFTVNPALFSADEVDRFIESIRIVFPTVDFNKNNHKDTLNKVLPELLEQAEKEATNAEDKAKIKQARELLQSDEREFVGFIVQYKKDENGQDIEKNLPILAKEVAADGSIREIWFRALKANHEYDVFNTSYTRAASIMQYGGLKELTNIELPNNFDFTQLSASNKSTLFNDYWTNIIHSGEFIRREYTENYKDENDASHHIVIERQENNQFEATMLSSKAFYNIRNQHKIRFSTMPTDNLYPNSNELDALIGADGRILTATLYQSQSSDTPACEFLRGCVYVAQSDLAQLTVLENAQSPSKAVYESATAPVYRALNEIDFTTNGVGIFSAPRLTSFEGKITSNQAGWNDEWLVRYKNNQVTLMEGKSSERIALPNSVATLQQLVAQIIASSQFEQRRVMLNDDLVWDYNMLTHQALKSDGVGNWWLYKMPNSLNVLVPNPAGVVDIVANGFILLAKKVNGVSDNPGKLALGDNGEIALPAADPNDSIEIDPNGNVSVGGVPVNQPKNGKKVRDRDYQPDGGSDTQFDDGSTTKVRYPDSSDGVNPQNLEVTRTEKAKLGADGKPSGQGRRIKSVVKYCKDKTKSFAQCPANKKVVDEYEYDATPNFLNNNLSCGAITPVSGVNQALKHQLWVQFFRMEADLYANPSEQGLDALLVFANQAVDQGLDVDEMNAQYQCVLQKIGNRLLAKYFDELEAGADNTQQLDAWKEHPDTDPFNKMKSTLDKLFDLNPSGMLPDYSDFLERTKEVKGRIIRKRGFDIPDPNDINTAASSLADAGEETFDKLSKYLKEVMDLEWMKQALGDESDGTAIADMCSDFNSVVAKLYQKYAIETANAPQMTEADIQFVLKLEANKAALGCSGNDSVLSELLAIAESAGLSSASLAAMGKEEISNNDSLNFKFGLFVKKVTKSIKGEGDEGYQTESQLRQAYLTQLMGVEFISEVTPINLSQSALFIDHIFKLQRLIQLVNNTAKNTQGVITDTEFSRMQGDLIAGLQQSWKQQWDEQISALNDAFTGDASTLVPILNELGVLYEQAKLLNKKMNSSFIEASKRTLINIDADTYLKLSVLGDSYDVIGLLKNQQNALRDSVWLKNLGTAELAQNYSVLNALESAVVHINNTAKQGKTDDLESFDTLINPLLTPYFTVTSNALAQSQITSENQVDDILRSGEQIHALMQSTKFPTAEPMFKNKVKALRKQVMDNIVSSNQEIQSYKLIAIARVYKLQGMETELTAGLEIDVIKAAQESLLNKIKPNQLAELINRNQTAKARNILKDIMALEFEAVLRGDEDSTILNEIADAINTLTEHELNKMSLSSDLKDVRLVLELEAEYQSIGGVDGQLTEISSAISNKSQQLRTSLESCIDTNSCTYNHYNIWMDFLELEAQTGSTVSMDMSMYDTMRNSSPITWDASQKHFVSLVSLKKRVTIEVGRRIVTAELLRLVASLDINNESDRVVLVGLVRQLETLEKIALSNGHQYSPNDANNRDPLRDVLEPLRGDLYLWQANKQDEIEAYLAENPGALTAAGKKQLANQFAVSEAEMDTVILPAMNNSMPLVPAAGNRYQQAAEILKGVNDKKGSTKLAVNFLEYIPNPELSNEQAVFAASVAVISEHIADELVGAPAIEALNQPSEQQMMLALEHLMQQQPNAIMGILGQEQGRYMTVASSNLPLMYVSLLQDIVAAQNGSGDLPALLSQFKSLFRQLLLLPTQAAPISELSTLIKQEFIEPLLGELSCQAQANEAINPLNCLLGAGINITSLGLDSFIQSQQNTNAENGNSLAVLKQMANQLSQLSTSDQADEFWLGMAAKSLSLTLNLVAEGGAVSTVTQTSQFVSALVSSGLDFSITLLQSDFVNGVIPPTVQPVKRFMLTGSELLQQKIENNIQSGRAFPILLAQITSDFVFEEMDKTPLSPVVPVAKAVSDWNLNFIGQSENWALLLSAIDNPQGVDPTPLLASLVSTDGLGQLTCALNTYLPGNIPNIPPALVLTPFVAVNELLNLKDENGETIDINSIAQNKRALLFIDVAAGLSNLWANPMSCAGVSDDLRLATLLRQFKKVDLSSGEMAAISTVGNLGLGALHALVGPNEPVLNAFDIAWNGSGNSPGIDYALKMGMSTRSNSGVANAINFLDYASKVPNTMALSLQALTTANSPTARVLRMVTGNVIRTDLLTPDELFGGENLALQKRFKMAIPNGLLASLGILRKAFTPLQKDNRDSYYETDQNDGYYPLRNNPQSAMSSPSRFFMLTADYARGGISALKPLFEGIEDNAVAAINERAMFSELTGTGAGFSGLSGGLQREWTKDWTNDNDFGDIEIQAYGNLSIPLVVDSAALMTFNAQGQDAVLTFSMAGDGAVSGIGLANDFSGALAVGDNGLGLSYDGSLSVEFMMRPMWDVAISGYVTDFEFPNSADLTDMGDYAIEQARNLSVGMCAEASTSVVPAPLSILFGTDFNIGVGVFAQKNSTQLLAGSRVSLNGTMNVPGFIGGLLPIGFQFGGNLTDAYQATFDPTQSSTSFEYQACASPGLKLNFFGAQIDLAGADVQIAAYTEGSGNGLKTGLKFKIGADSSSSNAINNTSNGLLNLLRCNVSSADLLKTFTCNLIEKSKLDTLWAVIEVKGPIDRPLQPKLIMGLGKDFPQKGGAPQLMFTPSITPVGFKPVGSWGGWPEVGVMPGLCEDTLCSGAVPNIGGN